MDTEPLFPRKPDDKRIPALQLTKKIILNLRISIFSNFVLNNNFNKIIVPKESITVEDTVIISRSLSVNKSYCDICKKKIIHAGNKIPGNNNLNSYDVMCKVFNLTAPLFCIYYTVVIMSINPSLRYSLD
jgi:hypothetical protein